MTYRHVIEVFRADPEFQMDSLLEKIRKNPTMLLVLDEKYGRHLESMLQQVNEGSAGQALSQFLRDWKPEGPTN